MMHFADSLEMRAVLIETNPLRVVVCLIAFVATINSLAAEPTADSVDRDYSAELPRVSPTQADNALKTFKLAPGFTIDLVAAEPLVVDPVAMAFDENGQLFVVEMRGYSEEGQQNLGHVRLLTDADDDGRFDNSTVYVDGLSWPTAVACWDGGIFVGAAPDILYCKDNNGDGIADERKIIYTGFGRGNVQGLLNSFTWGLDNRIHGATSSNGAIVRRPDQPDVPPLALRGRDFAFDPRTLDIQATSGGGQHGMSFDASGDKFVCSNSNHIQYVAFQDRYTARNPYLKSPPVRWSIAADGPQADVFRASPVEPWRTVRTRLRVKGIVPGPVERGGKAAGYFTGASGITIYRGGDLMHSNFGPWAFVADVGSNLIHRKQIRRQGIGFSAHRIDEKNEFLTSTDIWFRPVQMCNGPDGCLYVADMYREVIEHPKSLPPPIKKHLDLTSGRDRGRIYRIADQRYKHAAWPQLGNASAEELAETIGHAHGWQRETAARLLYERQDKTATPVLSKLAHESGSVPALFALDGLDALTADMLIQRLDDSNWKNRQAAVRLSERLLTDFVALREKLCAMASDENLRVRYQLAFTLGQFHGKRRNRALANIARRDANDPYLRFAVQSSLAVGAGEVFQELAADEQFRQAAAGRTFLKSLVAQIARQQRPADIAALLAVFRGLANEESPLLSELLAAAAFKADSPLARQIQAVTAGRSASVMAELLSSAARTAAGNKQPIADRQKAIHLLRLGSFAEQQPLLVKLLDAGQPVEVQLAAIETLATFDQPAVAKLLLERWPSFTPQVRNRAHDVLFSRERWTIATLQAALDARISPSELNASRVRLLSSHTDTNIRELAKQVSITAGNNDRAAVVEAYRSALTRTGDPKLGKQVFQKNCAACHRLEGIGHQLAPNLGTVQNRTAENILLNVLDPNREVNPSFVLYEIVTSDGRSLTGMIADETATSVTLKRASNETDTVLRVDIDEIHTTGLSLMPEGLEKQIDQAAMADLVAYLQSVE